MNTDALWQRKLLAFLHDPPEKAYDFGQSHEQRAGVHMSALGLAGVDLPDRQADWMSSAADRLVFPRGSSLCEKAVGFRHPLSGLPVSLEFPDRATAERAIGAVLPAFRDVDPCSRFWLLWRLWPQYAAEYENAEGCGTIPYLPADTRMPDHSIFNHCSVTSALEATRSEDGKKLEPAFLLFQLGPVQDFIAQARSTRDLWSGSYLLAYMTAHAIHHVARQFGPDSIIFPSLRGLPLFDWLNREVLGQARYRGSASYWETVERDPTWQDRVRTPLLPNRFLALVRSDFDPATSLAPAVNELWSEIAEKCLAWLARNGCALRAEHEARFRAQIARHWRMDWQVWPWMDADKAMRTAMENKATSNEGLKKLYDVALDVSKQAAYGRNSLDSAWAWQAHYLLCAHRLDARRQTRNFDAWPCREGMAKDDYSGVEETVIDEEWLKQAAGRREVAFLFRKPNERLGAANLVKRVWHKAYLDHVGLSRARDSFDSVPAVAAAPWRARLSAAEQSEWDHLVSAEGDDAKDAAGAFIATRKDRLGVPSNYYAILALDGDSMGKWLSGEKTPLLRQAMSGQAVKYFEGRERIAGILDLHRPLAPSYHLQFSEALANFGVYAVRRIVDIHHGQLVLAGGDDVLAMLPADEALACARNLRLAFQGSEELAERLPEAFVRTVSGFFRLRDGDGRNGSRRPAEPSWPLLAPGPRATVSVGIAIGHTKAPLQDMVREADKAERRAKGSLGRDALAVTLLKRSGETVEWGSGFDSPAFDLFDMMREYYRAVPDEPGKPRPIPGRFPYRVAELLRRYDGGSGVEVTPELAAIAMAEMTWAVRQIPSSQCPAEIREQLLGHMAAYLRDLGEGGGRKTEDGNEAKPRPLAEFWNLFALEAFIARQGK
jgi:CRISPR-associated protein Cas10/Cmr2 subtype III-B